MKFINHKKFNWLFLLPFLLIAFSCNPDDDHSAQEIEKNKIVNEWIKENMDVLYYWNTKMPAGKNMKVFPADYFESILYKQEDHFSFIAEDFAQLMETLSGVQLEAGYDFTLFYEDEKMQNLYGLINYIKPNSPASSAGLKRGDKFSTVNGKQITINNYQTLLNETYAAHTLGVLRNSTIQSFSLSVVKYEENPILLDSIYDYDMYGKKIAYLIYNFFSIDKGDDSRNYIKELNDVFGKYKQANINELILDLRYNSGGQVVVATALASMISNRESSDVFCIDQYNSIVDNEYKRIYGDIDYNKTFFANYLPKVNSGDADIPVNKLGIPRLYVLVSRNTASASELLINGLKPYIDVTLIGETTYGKNVGMALLYEDDPKKQKDNRWGMLPVVCKIFNSENKSDFSDGFRANIEVDEYKIKPMPPLGNIDEILLEAALVNIGVKSASPLRSGKTGFDSKPLKSSIDLTPERKNMFR